ncbi:Glu/Leu/Phe/Val dehydrogenase dimerization domain-containing protein [uncultured Umboniibacter sp.]|uniref:Glu/Leu/Phe/Val family dehydrogenase n=1 Tax=uncultured Umboniibacter sp. TaxID=1798917 RepID=UPI0026277246|nr:Glu/Leu/Phe/Val dehydrogenase dimerization domain-containing protein [uncultured Umboniibacter sp.]
MSVFSNRNFDQHENVVFHECRESGLKAIIAIHDSRLGPAMGGCRMFPYQNDAAAIDDVLRLSQGMTYKNALAGLPIGGGKAVIIGNAREANAETWRAMGDFVQSLSGRYITAEDSGTSVSAMQLIAQRTPYVTGVSSSQAHHGDPSPSTAKGVYFAMKESVRVRYGQNHLSGLTVGIQGFGNVGRHLCKLLIEAGVSVFGADPNLDNADRARALGAKIVDPGLLMTLPMDVFAPCAMGAILNTESIAKLQTGLVCGAANNQLATASVEQELMKREILYAPDFAVNSGGIIDAFSQYSPTANINVERQISEISNTLAAVFDYANSHSVTAGAAAVKLAKLRVENGLSSKDKLLSA